MNKERLLKINNGYNFRELGGYKTRDGHTIRWGRLIRSGALNRLTAVDEQVLAQLPVKVVIDLRGQPEVNAAPDRVPTTATYHHLPVFNVDVTNASRSDAEVAKEMQVVGNGFRHMLVEYDQMVKAPTAKHAYREMFRLLLANEDGATLFHCTAGKDRTGFGAFLILTALGVPQATIFDDYLLTNQATATFRKTWLASLRDTDQDLGNLDAVIKNRSDMIKAYREYLEHAVATVNQVAGSPQRYLTDYLGLTTGDLIDLRRLYLQ